MAWRFDVQLPGRRSRDSVLGEFFTSDGIDSVADAMVRESIQNSLDANAHPDTAIEMRIHVSQDGLTQSSERAELFADLAPHLQAVDRRLGESANGPCRYVVLEDFGTTGLRGNPTDFFGDGTAPEENEFYHFFLAEGRSSKGGGKRGSWGVGKHTFIQASGVNTLFGFTVRQDGTRLNLGQSILKSHKRGGNHYTSDGWWGQETEVDGHIVTLPFQDNADGVPLPQIERFRQLFGLERTTEPGLSIVIPFIDDQLSADVVAQAVLRNYALAIAAGDLTVQLTSDQTNRLVINRESLPGLLDTADMARTRREVQLAALVGEEFDRIELPEPNTTASWNDYTMPDETKASIVEALSRNKPFCVRVPVIVDDKSSRSQVVSHLDIAYLPDSAQSSKPTYYRRGIRVSEAAKNAITPGAHALVIIRDDPLATMLGLAEGPSHVDWSASTERFKGRFGNGRNTISFVRRAPVEVLRHARQSSDEEDLLAAAAFFSLTKPSAVEDMPARAPASRGASSAAMPDLATNKRTVHISTTGERGLRVAWTDAKPNAEYVVRAAYDVAKGNAFTNWSPNDFDLTDFTIELHHTEVLAIEANQIRVRISGTHPSLTVDGFDNNRDLVVRAEEAT